MVWSRAQYRHRISTSSLAPRPTRNCSKMFSNKICAPLVYYAAQNDRSLRMVPSSRVKKSKNFSISWHLKMGPTDCPETLVRNYYCILCNIPEEGRSHLHCSRRLKSWIKSDRSHFMHSHLKWDSNGSLLSTGGLGTYRRSKWWYVINMWYKYTLVQILTLTLLNSIPHMKFLCSLGDNGSSPLQ